MKIYIDKALVILLIIITISKPGFISAGESAKLSGVLAAVVCANNGDLVINNAQINPGQTVNCMASSGEIRMTNVTINEGATFSAKARSSSVANPSFPQWADTSCVNDGIIGSNDCNTCANNVRKQFNDLFSDKAVVSNGFWKLYQDRKYPPSNSTPKDEFSPEIIRGLSKHIQGFTKIGSTSYAGTYSDNGKGSIFFIDYDVVNKRLQLETLHHAWDDHPSGMSLLGKYVIFADPKDNDFDHKDLRVINAFASRVTSKTSLLINNWQIGNKTHSFSAGGGLGMVKLASGGYLLIATHPGGPTIDTDIDFEFDTFSPENPAKKTDFFYVEGKLNADNTLKEFGQDINNNNNLDMTVQHLGRWTQDSFGDNAKQAKYQYSENLSVVAECGSGDIYVIHTSNTKPWAIRQEKHAGFWRLSQVVWNSNTGPELDILAVFEEKQDWKRCFHRAAATAWVNTDHNIELSCSEYRLSNKTEDDMHFSTRTVN